jgi:hypothetical protein
MEDVKEAYIERFFIEKGRDYEIINRLEYGFEDVTTEVENKEMERFVGREVFKAYGRWWAAPFYIEPGPTEENTPVLLSTDEYKILVTVEDQSINSGLIVCPACKKEATIIGICPKCEEYRLGFKSKIICDCGFEAISRSKIK